MIHLTSDNTIPLTHLVKIIEVGMSVLGVDNFNITCKAQQLSIIVRTEEGINIQATGPSFGVRYLDIFLDLEQINKTKLKLEFKRLLSRLEDEKQKRQEIWN